MAQRVNIEVLNKAAVDVTVQNSNAINVEVPTAPRGLSAEFTANQTEIDQGQSVDFSATNAGFQYFFSIEDVGGFIFKSGKDVSHEFRNIGQFDVALTQADLNQKVSGIQVKRDFIKVNQAPFLLNQPFGTGATAAYSLRKLKSSATKAVRVREDASNTETDIGFVGIELDKTALLNHCGSANGFVSKWYDQSGNGNDASNSTASGQPQIVSSGTVIKDSNGNPAINYQNSNGLQVDTNINSTLTGSINFTLYAKSEVFANEVRNPLIVKQAARAAPDKVDIGFALGGNQFNTRISDGSNPNAFEGGTFNLNSVLKVYSRLSSTKIEILEGQANSIGTEQRTIDPANNFNLFIGFDNRAPAPLNGLISEAIIFNDAKSDNDIKQISLS